MYASFFRLCCIPFFGFLLCTYTSEAQQPGQARANLERLAATQANRHAAARKQVQDYAARQGIPLQFTDPKGNQVTLMEIDTLGHPLYYTTFNAGAAITTGVPQLQTGGNLGINLNGKGFTVGVWDGGKVKTHQEFDTRLVAYQGTTYSGHATHVTGTIIASGITPAAKGMAPLAQATTRDFDNDEAEIASLAAPDESSILLSNHSYGILMGFYTDADGAAAWAGNPAISTLEDYRFGFYDTHAQTLDDIAMNAPYYTMVWAAGNDRNDKGNGTYPADGNQGTGYDCIGLQAVAKNIITVGAVRKVTEYLGPESVQMAFFSSWGPTDDGRIKPDLVAAGMGVYSSFVNAAGADTYATLQGTSMAAPNVTGSLVLLQELYQKLHGGHSMKAATLKALAIHTAREAGDYEGPDYQFGWGLLNVEDAANVLLEEDLPGTSIQEDTLIDQQTYQYNLTVAANTTVTATLVWTDPPGTPVSPQLDPMDQMLVNDLDMVITDSEGNTHAPWVLNPTNPAGAAIRADNARDNVEKVTFLATSEGQYQLTISHKKSLENSLQPFSLVLTYTPQNDPSQTLYWIGGEGQWQDPQAWAFTSGGEPADAIPTIHTRVIIDDNAFAADNQSISLTDDAVCASLHWLTETPASLALQTHALTIDGSLAITSENFTASSTGEIILTGQYLTENQISMLGVDLSLVTLIINSPQNATWTATGTFHLAALQLIQGTLLAPNTHWQIAELTTSSEQTQILDLTAATITGITQSSLASASLQWSTSNTTLQLADGTDATLAWDGLTFQGQLDTGDANTTVSGDVTINATVVNGNLTLTGNNQFGQFEASSGATLTMAEGTTQTFTDQTTWQGQEDNPVTIQSSSGTATLYFDGHYKLCFDYLNVLGVAISGDATISAGTHSTLTNATQWRTGLCEETPFADFEAIFTCQDSYVQFNNLSTGAIVSYAWNFGDAASASNTSSQANPYHIYTETGTYTVSLTVTNGDVNNQYAQAIEITENNLATNDIVLANGKLYSEEIASGYQWYKDGESLEGAIARSYDYLGDIGTYVVLVNDGTCNRPSSAFIITAVDNETPLAQRITLYPNPAVSKLYIRMPADQLPASITIRNTQGQAVWTDTLVAEETYLPVNTLPTGFYIADIVAKETVRKKIIVKK